METGALLEWRADDAAGARNVAGVWLLILKARKDLHVKLDRGIKQGAVAGAFFWYEFTFSSAEPSRPSYELQTIRSR